MLRPLILDQRRARRFAGRAVAEMIALGASAEAMRRNGIPRSVFYGVFGGRKWESTTPGAYAAEMVGAYRPDMIFGGRPRRGVEGVGARRPADARPQGARDVEDGQGAEEEAEIPAAPRPRPGVAGNII